MSFIKIWVHVVFSTKHRKPFLIKPYRETIFNHIKENAKQKGIYLQAINGYNDHIHCLISVGKEQNISQIIQLIKGESSFWINKNKIIPYKFSWQDDYFAVSVSESQIKTVLQYIAKQEEHHSKKTYSKEVAEFVEKYGFINCKEDLAKANE